MARRIAGDRADRAIFHVDVERAATAEHLVQLRAAFGQDQPVLRCGLAALFAGEGFGTRAAEQHVRAVHHHRAGERHRVARGRNARHSTRRPVAPVHDRGVKLGHACASQRSPAPGVEVRVVFQHAHRRFDRVERRSAI